MNLAGRGIWLAVVVLLAALLSQWLPADSALLGSWRWVAAILVALFAVEGATTRHWVLRVEVLTPSTPLRLGRVQVISARLDHDKATPLVLDAFWALPAAGVGTAAPQRFTVVAGEGATLSLAMTPTQLGTLTLAPLQLRIRGFLGLAWWSRLLPVEGAPLKVFPDLLGAGTRRAGLTHGGDAATGRRGEGTELWGLRDYRPGDSLRAIAWKASARRNRYVVREWVQEEHLDVLLVVDVGRSSAMRFGALTMLHHSVNIAARLAERAVLEGDRVGVVAYGSEVRARTPLAGGVAGVRSARSLLGALRSRSEESDPLAAAMAVRQLCRVRALVIWFTDAEVGMQGGPLLPALRGLAPKHLSLVGSLRDPSLETLEHAFPVAWDDPYASIAAGHMVEARRRAGHALARLGCEAVTATPDQLDDALLERFLHLRRRHRV